MAQPTGTVKCRLGETAVVQGTAGLVCAREGQKGESRGQAGIEHGAATTAGALRWEGGSFPQG
jgi:hypothetical protein